MVAAFARLDQAAIAAELGKCGRLNTLICLHVSSPGGATMRSIIVLLKTLFMAACAIALFAFITSKLRGLDRFIPVRRPVVQNGWL